MDRTGIYGVFALKGAPLDRQAAVAMGFGTIAASGPDPAEVEAGALVRAANPNAQRPGDPASLAIYSDASAVATVVDLAFPAMAQRGQRGDRLTLFLGQIHAAAALAQQLGMPADSRHVDLARAALDQFGAAMRTCVYGDWLVADWNGRALTLVSSFGLRDPLFYSVHGTQIALSPDIRQLSNIAWIGRTFDPLGMLAAMSFERVRYQLDPVTVLPGVHALRAASHVVIDANGVQTAPPVTFDDPEDWNGTLADAMAQAQAMLLTVTRDHMVGGHYAGMLSGGLDSSIIAWALAQSRQPGEDLRFLTTAAAPGSGQVDEVAAARRTAAYLGAEHIAVVAPTDCNVYCPTDRDFRAANGPVFGAYHYIFRKFVDVLQRAQLSQVFEGRVGELLMSYPDPLRGQIHDLRARPALSVADKWRIRLRPLRRRLHMQSDRSVHNGFIPLLAPHWRAQLPDVLGAALEVPDMFTVVARPGERWGVPAGMLKAQRLPLALGLGELRQVIPFRDLRMATLFAKFPASTLYPTPGGRDAARLFLQDKLPDAIRFAEKGPPFAPEYLNRLVSDAPAARARMPLLRAAGAGDWVDLDALDMGLAAHAAGRVGRQSVSVQLTAILAEYCLWWRGQG